MRPSRPTPLRSAALAALAVLALGACKADPAANPMAPRTPDAPFAPGPGFSTGGSPGTQPPPPPPTAGTGGATAPGTAGAGSGGQSSTPAPDAGMDAGTPPLPLCDEDAGVEDDAGTLGTCVAIGDLRLQYRASDTNATDNQIKPHFNLVNDGDEAVPLAELTIRYWFTREPGATTQVFWCDYALMGCGQVRGAFVTSDRQGGDHYLELSFASGSLAGGAQTGEIQARFNKEDWSVYNESDDFSFDPSKTAFADWHKVTLYRRGVLAWGAEPGL